jgi:mannose-6-phosphate isomerase-like protein (cupin superfamily)
MSENGWRTLRLSEVKPIPSPCAEEIQGWLPLRHALGVEAFGVNAWLGREAGDEVIEKHAELGEDPTDNHEELYLVIEGHATFTVDGQEVDAPRGTLIFVKDPAIVRHAVARSAGTTVLAIGAAPGKAFEPSPWEQRGIEAAVI